MVTLREEDASPSSSGVIYDVFLSFRYEDIGKKFANHLHAALYHSGFLVFRPNEDMEIGENINSELQKVIKDSRISIIVFSNGYASSSLCLDGLVMILQHKRTSSGGHHVIPVFYDVDPSDVRKQRGSFKEAFESYKEGERKNGWKSRVEGWKAALREVADLPGMHLQNEAEGYEAECIQDFVQHLRVTLRHQILHMPAYPVGIASCVKFIQSWLDDRSSDFGTLVICGIGGSGKTTSVKFVYNLNWSRFQGSSFLANITEASKQENGLIALQTQLLSDITKERGERVNSVYERLVKIQDALKCKSVLLVLDDLETREQMEAIVGICDCFCKGSKIIITTRDGNIL